MINRLMIQNIIYDSAVFNRFNKDYKLSQMKQKYYFCFRFDSITLLNNIEKDLAAMAKFQIQIFKNKKSLGHTHDIVCSPNQEGVIHLNNQTLKFTIMIKPNQLIKHSCEIRLLELIPGGQKIIGSYEFLLDNYIQANKDLHRSCIEMKVEIGQNFIIDYIVYLESTIQALEKIVKEHQAAKQFQLLDYNDGQQFLPEELQNTIFQVEQKVVNYDLQSPLIIRQKYWSPKKRQNLSGVNLKLLPSNNDQIMPQSPKRPRRKSLMKVKKAQSNMSDNTTNTLRKTMFLKKQKKFVNQMEKQVDELAQHEDINISNQQLYKVICSDSKIKLSPTNSDDQRDEKKKISSISLHELKGLKQKNQLKKISYKKWIIIAIFIIISIVLINIIQGSTSKKLFKKQKITKGRRKVTSKD